MLGMWGGYTGMIRKCFSFIQLYRREVIVAVLPIALLYPLGFITSHWVSFADALVNPFRSNPFQWLRQPYGILYIILVIIFPNFVICTIVGMFFGVHYKQRGLRLALIFGISMYFTQTGLIVLYAIGSTGWEMVWGSVLVNLGYIVLPVTFSWIILRRYPQQQPGYCIKCGYNLTGNTSGTCPECGIGIQT